MKLQTKSIRAQMVDDVEIAIRCRRIWKNSSIFWMIIDYVINIIAFSSSIAAIIVEVLIPNNAILVIIFSTFAASLTFIGFAINPKHKMRIYRKAFSQINAVLIRYYEENNDNSKKKDVVEAIIKGEDIIDTTYDVD